MAGKWLLQKLTQENMAQSQLAEWLGVSRPQLNQWLSGQNPIPDWHYISISEKLRFTDEERDEFLRVTSAQSLNNKLFDAFDPNKSKNKGADRTVTNPDLRSFFARPLDIYSRLLNRVEVNATADEVFFHNKYYAIWQHINAAYRVVQDIDKFLRQTESNFWTRENILPHLTYPHLQYVGFFVMEISEADGPLVGLLKSDIRTAIACQTDFKNSENDRDKTIAHHAIHVEKRFFPDAESSAFLKQPDSIQAERMALFGEVFRLGDKSDFEKLAETIIDNEKLGDATVAFDALHYGDDRQYRNEPTTSLLPVNSLLRHLHTLTDKRLFVRKLAAVRIQNILSRYKDRIASDVRLCALLSDRITTLDQQLGNDGVEREAYEAVVHIIQQARKN